MRLSVRPGVRINHSTRFSRDLGGAPKQTEDACLSRDSDPISAQRDSRVSAHVKKKRELFSGPPRPSPASLALPLTIHVLVWEY